VAEAVAPGKVGDFRRGVHFVAAYLYLRPVGNLSFRSGYTIRRSRPRKALLPVRPLFRLSCTTRGRAK